MQTYILAAEITDMMKKNPVWVETKEKKESLNHISFDTHHVYLWTIRSTGWLGKYSVSAEEVVFFPKPGEIQVPGKGFTVRLEPRLTPTPRQFGDST